MRYFRSSKTQSKIFHLIDNNLPIIVFDTETTGLEDDAKIIQLSAKKIIIKKKTFNSAYIEILDEFDIYINPQCELPENIIELTGITDEILKDKDCENIAIEKIEKFFENKPYVAAYNAQFDFKKMYAMYQRCGKDFKIAGWIDVIDMVRDLNKRMPITLKSTDGKKIFPYNLSNVTNTYNLNEGIDFHNASGDVVATIRVMELCTNYYLQNPTVEGNTVLQVNSVSYYDPMKLKQGHTERRLNINTDRGLVYFNTYYKYYASNEIDLRFVDINKLEDSVCNLTKEKPYTLHTFKRCVYR